MILNEWMNGELSPRCVVCYHKNTHLNSEASWPRTVPSQGVFTTSVKITGAWKLCQKIWIGKYCPDFQIGREKEKLQKLSTAASDVEGRPVHWPKAQTRATLPGLKQAWAVDPLLSFSAYQFPHMKMEIKTRISYDWCARKWVNVS